MSLLMKLTTSAHELFCNITVPLTLVYLPSSTPFFPIYRGSYMSALILLNFMKGVQEEIKYEAVLSILSYSSNKC